jgi:LPS sulfotransferase NodH
MKKIITIISFARSGSTYFCDLLDNFTNINSNYELFSPYKNKLDVTINKNYRKVLDINFLQSIKKEDPHRVLNILLETISEPILSYKIFEDHLSKSQREGIIARSDLIIFLYRNQMDSYISFDKAYKHDVWSCVDTSHIKINFDKCFFIYRKNCITNWYDFTKSFVKEKLTPFFEIDYDKLCELSFRDQLEYLKKNIENGLNVKLFLNKNPTILLTKQDKSKSYSDKIENYEEFKDFIDAERLEYKQSYMNVLTDVCPS